MGNDIEATSRALEARMNAIFETKIMREAIVKTYVLNQYELLATGCGVTISAVSLNKLVIKLFEEQIDVDLKTVRETIAGLRRRLIALYPFWIPNRLHLPIGLAWMRVAFREQARAAFLEALPLIEGMVIDSDHYAQLFINCRFYPLSTEHPWITGSARPWHLPMRFFDAMKKAWPKGDGPKIDVERIVGRLYHTE